MKFLLPLLALFCFSLAGVGCKSSCCGSCGGDAAKACPAGCDKPCCKKA
ncbi:MAG: hypothetical protein KTR15_07190 [Phycisphaeraceae bacterium]|nr:hypothetical protein [Phycisphaeraceae bacterium]